MILEAAAFFCLTQLVYFEARNQEEPEAKRAVVYTALNRLRNSRWPDTACGVVRQKNQFTFYWDGKPEKVYEPEAWKDAEQAVHDALEFMPHENGGWTHYHHYSIKPKWSLSMLGGDRIGDHIFYYERRDVE